MDTSTFERKNMSDLATEITRELRMSDTEQKVRYAIGAAAAAAAIFAPLSYKWKGVLTTIAAETILSAIYGVSPVKRLLHA
jgi:hypothetical protein